MTAIMNTTDWGTYLSVVNRESNNFLGITLLICSLIVFVLAFYNKGLGSALAASGFINIIVAIILFVLQVLASYMIIFPVVVFAAGLIGKKLTDT